jgi:hypothetical protein
LGKGELSSSCLKKQKARPDPICALEFFGL